MDTLLPDSQPYFEHGDFEEVLEEGKNLKERRKIVGAFLYEDTTTLLFSRTNYGKSLLAFQFAYAAATGSQFDPCAALQRLRTHESCCFRFRARQARPLGKARCCAER